MRRASHSITNKCKWINLSPCMAVTVEIDTGTRRIISSPLAAGEVRERQSAGRSSEGTPAGLSSGRGR
jgi:hypothetical protein